MHQPVDDREWDPERWARAIKSPHRAVFRVEVWADGVQQTERAPYSQGSVTEDWVTAGPRWSLSLTPPASPAWRRWLAMQSVELRPYRGVKLNRTTTWWCPMGRYPVPPPPQGRPWSGAPISAEDYWSWISEGKWPLPIISPGGRISDQIEWAIREAGLGDVDVRATSTAEREPVFIDKQRDEWIGSAARSISAEVSLDRTGRPVVQDARRIGTPTTDLRGSVTSMVWTPEWAKVYNAVDVESSASNVDVRVRVALTDPKHPASPWRLGSSVRPRWRVYGYSSPLITTQSQAVSAGQRILERVSAAATKWSYTAVPDPTRSGGDSAYAPTLSNGVQVVQLQSIQTPLTLDGGPQQIDTVSTNTGELE
ncbi:hypothetical protein FDO65_10135 [Nakamurella flava]|uniref:Uncharacterized protein n=1 Tax=Nakamurella flava TaxID=2576308 RepID=A0A4U6QMQ1_9ACTN|nr:hypothetical protein [Nakamurella flava]TKV61873.1 hypothetical protein FDO65_10135 [Nakamurella flava]